MIKSNKNALLTAVLLVGTIGFANCTTAPTAINNGNTVVVTKPAGATTDAAKTETAAGDKVGVPECDEYIQKYEACINSKVPEAQRAMFKTSFESARQSWKAAAANPQTKTTLASVCKQAQESAKQSMTAFSCAW